MLPIPENSNPAAVAQANAAALAERSDQLTTPSIPPALAETAAATDPGTEPRTVDGAFIIKRDPRPRGVLIISIVGPTFHSVTSVEAKSFITEEKYRFGLADASIDVGSGHAYPVSADDYSKPPQPNSSAVMFRADYKLQSLGV